MPADEQAAGGPLVGDPELVSGEQSCAAGEGNAPWYPTIAAFEVHDSDRTHLYDCAHFLGSMSGSNQVFAYSSQQEYATPYNIVDEGPNELFVYGGGYGDNPAASGSFVARVEPGTLNQMWRRVLINTNATGEWNYPGVVNVLADGSLVVIYGYHIAKLDPATGAILAQTTLPTGASAPGDTSYNGYDALPDGTIIAKTVNRQKGCTEQGFSAFLQCPDPTDVPPSVMVAINPKTLKVTAQITLPEMIGGRVTTTVYNGKNEIYLPGTSKLYRYTYQDGAFSLDRELGPSPLPQNRSDRRISGSCPGPLHRRDDQRRQAHLHADERRRGLPGRRQPDRQSAALRQQRHQEQLHPVDGVRRPAQQPDLRDGRRSRGSSRGQPPGRETLRRLDPGPDHPELHHAHRPERPPGADRDQHPSQILQRPQVLQHRTGHLAQRADRRRCSPPPASSRK